jgi:glutamate/tyrosine decarboxylase-like PLP-dependent enzyme
VPVALEAHVISAIGRRIGFGERAGGHFTTGGAEANLTALVCALTRSRPGFATDGAQAFSGRPTFYVSTDSHLAWLKIAHQCGIGRSAVRLVATDGSGRMSEEALLAAIAMDLANGLCPVMVAATAGTTNAGMVDPLAACAAAAQAHELWFHVDAAWGGGAIASDRLRGLLAGMELADSVTIDAHKWFATTMGCGMFITRDTPVLSAAFQVSTTYMPSNVQHLDPYVTSVQWSRRFLGLRLFLSLAAAGWEGYGRHVEHAIDAAHSLQDTLHRLGWTTLNASSLAVLCLVPPAGSRAPHEIVASVLRSGRAWISTVTFEGRSAVRACVTHGETGPSDLATLVSALEEARIGAL